MYTVPPPRAITRAAPPAMRPTGALEPVSASGVLPPLGVAFGEGEGDDFSGGTCAEVGGVVDGLGLAGGVDSSAGGVLSTGVPGVSGGAETGWVGVGVGDSGVLGVHSLSPPFQAAMRWYGVMMLSGW
jgi:hypothetical protein